MKTKNQNSKLVKNNFQSKAKPRKNITIIPPSSDVSDFILYRNKNSAEPLIIKSTMFEENRNKNKKPFKCDLCTFEAKYQGNLLNHIDR